MLKLKIALIAIAIACALGGAFATRPNTFCETQTQYYKFGSSYYPAGTYGTDYVCVGSAGICTYYQTNPFDPNSFAPCRFGGFQFIY